MHFSLTCGWNSRWSGATLRACFAGCQESRLFVFWQSSPRKVLLLSVVHNVSQAHMFQADGWKKMKKKKSLISLGNIPDITHITSHIVSSRILSHGHAMGEVSNWKTSFLVWLSARRKARSSVDQRRAERELETAKLVSYQLVTLERKGRAFSLNAQNISDAEVRETQRMIKSYGQHLPGWQKAEAFIHFYNVGDLNVEMNINNVRIAKGFNDRIYEFQVAREYLFVLFKWKLHREKRTGILWTGNIKYVGRSKF